MKQLREVGRSCVQDKMEADESYFVKQRSDMGRFTSFADEASLAVIIL